MNLLKPLPLLLFFLLLIYIGFTLFQTASAQSNDSKTLFWIPLYFDNNINVQNSERIVAALAKSNAQGFNVQVGFDFLNSNTRIISDDEYSKLKTVIDYAKGLGMDSLFLSIRVDTYSEDLGFERNPNGEGHKAYGWDVFDPRVVQRIEETAKRQAAFAKNLGLAGIWVDTEPYGDWVIWNPYNPNERINTSTKSEAEIKSAYFALGQRFMNGLISEYPDVQVILSPGFVDNAGQAYRFYPDFYAGMLSVNSQKGIVIASEISYGYPDDYHAGIIACYEMGRCDANGHDTTFTSHPEWWSPVRKVLQDYDQNGNQNLWNKHTNSSSIALSFGTDYGTDGGNENDSSQSIDKFKTAISNRRSLSPKFNWIYSESQYWLQGKSANCPFSDWPSDVPCLGKILAQSVKSPELPDNLIIDGNLSVQGSGNFAGNFTIGQNLTLISGFNLARKNYELDSCRPATVGLLITADNNYTLGDPVVQECKSKGPADTHMYVCGARWNGGPNYHYGWICLNH